MSSSMRLNDAIALNKINPYTDPMEFTPGVPLGGAYKTIYAPTSKTQVALANSVRPVGDALGGIIASQNMEPSQGCEKTTAAGWRTPYYCTPGSQDYPLNRRMVPERNYSLPPWEMNISRLNNDSIINKKEGMFANMHTANLVGNISSVILISIAVIALFKVL
jgi:hypothetical protein